MVSLEFPSSKLIVYLTSMTVFTFTLAYGNDLIIKDEHGALVLNSIAKISVSPGSMSIMA